MRHPKDVTTPVFRHVQQAVVTLAVAHVAAVAEAQADPNGEGAVTATWVGDVLIVSAHGGEAEKLATVLVREEIASPERAA